MNTKIKNNTVLIAAILLACGTIASLDAGARERGRSVQRTGNVHEGSVSRQRDNARGESDRTRDWQRDGQGNASGSTSRDVTGANGGSAERQGSYERNADGSASHQGSMSATGKNGGTMESSGSTTRDADGNVSGSRTTSATGKNGGTYNGSTTWENGEVTHTGTVTGANGGTSQTNGSYTRGDDGKFDGSRTTTATGAKGGTYNGTTTLDDGQVTHTGTRTGANGGTIQSEGSYSRGEDGKVDGSRSSTATGANGATYNGSTTIDDGQVTHTGTCTNSAGETVDCPTRSDDDGQ
ncbi:MAG: hypothetical protein QM719_10695 [Thermomonas sp.]